MGVSSQIIIFIIGFIVGSSAIAFLYYFFNYFNKLEENKNEDLSSIKDDMDSIKLAFQNFNLAQNRIENTLVRGGAQQQGAWGEFVLKNILDSVGLREGEEYETQESFRDDEGKLQKPDVVVHMPGNRDIIIDSKVSLNAWHDYSNTKDETNKVVHLKKFLDAVKTFVIKLSKDDYSKLYDINTIDNVLMFVPIEPALLTLYHEGIKIIEDAWQKKIIIVGPSTLPFLLKAIENMWRVDKQTKTIKDIAASATDIYNKTVNVYNSFELASQSIDKAKSKMKDAKSQLQDGPGSLTSKLNNMKKLGRLNAKKELPDGMEDDIN